LRRRPAATFEQQALALAWGAWVELGTSGWTASHGKWAVDPEPLILFTAFLGDSDPRLRDEATDWCIRNWRQVSKVRLKNLLRRQPPEVRDAFGEFAATVGAHAGIAWPGATDPRRFKVTGRSKLPPLDRPSLVWLRLRAVFGLGARTEILRFFLSEEGTRASVSAITSASGYLKRTVAEECESLERAGVLSVRTIGNRFDYALARPAELKNFVGELPPVRPDWTAVLNVARELVVIEAKALPASPRLRGVKAKAALRSMQSDLESLDIGVPSTDVVGSQIWADLKVLGDATLGAWSLARWHADA